jgi:FkbM family methyltransferase
MALARLFDEIRFAGPEHLDSDYVAGYDRKAAFDPTADLADLVERGLGGESTVIDLGAGPGTFALAAAALCRRVIAVDVSPAMVSAIRSRASEQELTNVEAVQAGFLSYEHTGAPADFVYTRNALHHLPDFWKAIALRRVADLLRPHGVLRLRDLVFSFELREAERFIHNWLEDGADRAEDGWTREELEAHLRDEYSTFTWLLEPMFGRAGFEIERAEYGRFNVYADYICATRDVR